jgi:hypothetical protein
LARWRRAERDAVDRIHAEWIRRAATELPHFRDDRRDAPRSKPDGQPLGRSPGAHGFVQKTGDIAIHRQAHIAGEAAITAPGSSTARAFVASGQVERCARQKKVSKGA